MKSCGNHGSRSKMHIFLFVAMFMIATLLSDAGNCWEIETVDDGKRDFDFMTEQSVVVDSLGNPHIAYGGDHLYYTWFDGTLWHYEIVDGAESVGRWASIALDSVCRPHICYYDSDEQAIKYANKCGLSWSIVTIDTIGQGGDNLSIDIGINGEPCIAYFDGDDSVLKFACLLDSEWIVENVDIEAEFGGALEIDSEGQPHIGYTGTLESRYAYRDTNGWHIEEVGEQEAVCLFVSLELDEFDRPHSTWGSIGGYEDGLVYAVRSDTGWVWEVISAASPFTFYSIEIDGEGFPHIVHEDEGLIYAQKDETGWSFNVIDPRYALEFGSLALDDEGRKHVTYKSRYEDQLCYALCDESGWEIQTVEWNPGLTSTATPLSLDTFEYPCIAYTDYLRSSYVCFAQKSSSTWNSEYITASGTYISLCMDDNEPNIVYCDYIDPTWRGDFVYANKPDSFWNIEIVAGEGNNGSFCDIDIDSFGQPHSSFIGSTPEGSGLRYATKSGTDWVIVNVDPDFPFVGSTSIEVDDFGLIHIAANDRLQGHLKYYLWNGTGWNMEIVDEEAYVEYDVSLSIDVSGSPHLAYRDDSFPAYHSLKYAKKSDTQWTIETVDGTGNTGYRPSIATDPAGFPHICYTSLSSSSRDDYLIKYAFRSPIGWHIETIDSVGSSYTSSSLVIDSTGKPHIGYFSYKDHAVKYARKTEGFDLVMGGNVTGGEFVLEWAPAVGAEHWVYGASNKPFFIPGVAPGYDFRVAILQPDIVSWQSSAGIGIPGDDWTYMIIAVDEMGEEIGRSNRVGEMDFLTDIP